tara:strand:- start:138 stop:521 length:384 start_codon:yes stop_codon:yes gene_type:complete
VFFKLFTSTILLAHVPLNVNEKSCSEYASKYCLNQTLVPIVQVGDKCPSSFYSNNGYCMPLTNDVMGVIPIYDGQLPNKCPIGYRNNRGYCQSSPNLKQNALPMIGEKCPRGYRKNQSFCFKLCKQR